MSESEMSRTSAISVDAIKRLADLVEQNGLSELRYEEGDVRVTLRTSAYRPAAPATPFAPASAPPIATALEHEAGDAAEASDIIVDDAEGQVRVEAPLMGVFYRGAKPEDPPFVDIGDSVEVGQVIGLIEAMKVFSEVPSDVAGIVRSIPAKNGSLVQPGEALIVLEPQ